MLTVFCVPGLLLTGSSVAAQVAVSPGQVTDTVLARQIRSLEDITLAHRLAVHGQRARKPLPLITAAEILLDNPARPLEPPPADTVGDDAVIPDPRRLLASARALAGNDERLLAVIRPLEQAARQVSRGSVRGARQLYGRVTSAARREHMVEFRGGEPAVVYVSGDGDSDLDVFVHDMAGRLVASSVGPRDECVVRWVPDRQQVFRVEVRNVGQASNWYWMATN
jgi:hypothetical protein